jgi:hypothetical protein
MLRPETTTTKTVSDFKPLSYDTTSATVSINGNNLDPSPFISIAIEKRMVHDFVFGGFWRIRISGVVYSDTFGGTLPQILNKLNDIRDSSECVNLVIGCDGSDLINGYGRISSFNISEGDQPSWVNVVPYDIEIELFTNNGAFTVKKSAELMSIYNITDNMLIQDISESINLSYDQSSINGDNVDGLGIIASKAHIVLSFDITVSGANICNNLDLETTHGLIAAENIILYRIDSLRSGQWTRVGGDQTNADIQGYLLGSSSFLEISRVRVDPITGTISVSGSLTYRPTGCTYDNAFIDINVESSVNAERELERNVNVAGTITGLTNRPFTSIISNANFNNTDTNRVEIAESVFSAIKTSILSVALAHRDNAIIDPACAGSLNQCGESDARVCEDDLKIVSMGVTKNYSEGSLSFNAVVSNKKFCNLAGFLYYNTEITEDYGNQQIITHTIVGRGYPIMQNINCNTPQKRTITVTGQLATCGSGDFDTLKSCVDNSCQEYVPQEALGSWFLTQNQYTIGNNGSFRCIKEYTLSGC